MKQYIALNKNKSYIHTSTIQKFGIYLEIYFKIFLNEVFCAHQDCIYIFKYAE